MADLNRSQDQGKVANIDTIGVDEPRQIVEHGDFVTATEERDLKRGLAQRHIQMIALAGKRYAVSTTHIDPLPTISQAPSEQDSFSVWDRHYRPADHLALFSDMPSWD